MKPIYLHPPPSSFLLPSFVALIALKTKIVSAIGEHFTPISEKQEEKRASCVHFNLFIKLAIRKERYKKVNNDCERN